MGAKDYVEDIEARCEEREVSHMCANLKFQNK